jgi:hypothetical protein
VRRASAFNVLLASTAAWIQVMWRLAKGITSRKSAAASLGDFSHLRVDALNGVGGLDHLSNCLVEKRKKNDSITGAPP